MARSGADVEDHAARLCEESIGVKGSGHFFGEDMPDGKPQFDKGTITIGLKVSEEELGRSDGCLEKI